MPRIIRTICRAFKRKQPAYKNIAGNLIHVTAQIDWEHVKMGTGNVIDAYAVIGSPGEIKGVEDFYGKVVIGHNNHIGEGVTVHRPPEPEERTEIGDHCYIMARAHIPHHAIIHNNVTMATGATIGGHCVVHKGAYLGLHCVVRPRLSIGPVAMVAMNSTVTKDVPQHQTWAGTPAKFLQWNEVGLLRNGYTPEEVEQITELEP